jgi:hypothetical protein
MRVYGEYYKSSSKVVRGVVVVAVDQRWVDQIECQWGVGMTQGIGMVVANNIIHKEILHNPLIIMGIHVGLDIEAFLVVTVEMRIENKNNVDMRRGKREEITNRTMKG